MILSVVASVVTATRAAPEAQIVVSVNRAKVQRGETVEVTIVSESPDQVQAVLLMPTVGNHPLVIKPGATPKTLRAQVSLRGDAPEGLYVIHAWTGSASRPASVGKA